MLTNVQQDTPGDQTTQSPATSYWAMQDLNKPEGKFAYWWHCLEENGRCGMSDNGSVNIHSPGTHSIANSSLPVQATSPKLRVGLAVTSTLYFLSCSLLTLTGQSLQFVQSDVLG